MAAAGDLDGSHRGLVNMAERAREIGGRLEIRRAREGGIRIQVGVPLPIPSRAHQASTGAGAGDDAGHATGDHDPRSAP